MPLTRGGLILDKDADKRGGDEEYSTLDELSARNDELCVLPKGMSRLRTFG